MNSFEIYRQRFKQYLEQLSHRQWPAFAYMMARYAWPGFMLLLCAGLLFVNWEQLNLQTITGLVILLVMITVIAFRWRALQYSLLLISLMYPLLLLLASTEQLIRFFIQLDAVLLFLGIVVVLSMNFLSTRPSTLMVNAYLWFLVVTGILLLIAFNQSLPVAGLYIASLALASLEGFLLICWLTGLIWYLWYQRTNTRINGDYFITLPLLLFGLYTVYRLNLQSNTLIQLPHGLLEHGLLLLHVPAFILGFALMLLSAGMALLRLLSDTDWLSAAENRDIVETCQIWLEDRLYFHQKLAIIFLAVGLFTGFIWSNMSWGHYWQADARIFLSFSCWLFMLAGLHLRMQHGMQTRTYAWWCLAGLFWIVSILVGTNGWESGLHNFSGM